METDQTTLGTVCTFQSRINQSLNMRPYSGNSQFQRMENCKMDKLLILIQYTVNNKHK